MGSGCCTRTCCTRICCTSNCCRRSEESEKRIVASPDSPTPIKAVPVQSQSPPLLIQKPYKSSGKRIDRPPPKTFDEDFIIVWLNPSADIDPEKTQEEEEELQEVANTVVIFTDPTECEEFINGVKDEKILLLLSDSAVENLSPMIQTAPQIDYMCCLATEGTTTTDSEIVRTIPEACVKLADALRKGGRNLLKPVILETDPEKIKFMYSELCRDVIMTSKENDVEDLYHLLAKIHAKQKKEMIFLKSLKDNYSTKSSIVWYTEESCLFRTLNHYLRTHQYENLYDFRVFIRHLHQELVRLKVNDDPSRKFYRGQALDEKELQRFRENIRKPTYFPNFLSTSTSREVAEGFAERSRNKDPRGKVEVILVLEVDKNFNTPFANIGHLTAYPDEKEWLFSMGSVFRIENIIIPANKNGKHIIQLKSMNNNDEQLIMLREHLKRLIIDENICMSFGRLLYQVGKYEKSREIYEKGLQREDEPYRRAAVRSNLGSTALKLSNHTESARIYEDVLKIERKDGDSSRKHLAVTYNNLATVLYKEKKIDSAVENLRRAIQAYNEQPNGDLSLIASIYNNMACILNAQGKHGQALANNEKCLRFRRAVLPPIHPDLAIAYNSMAITYHHLYLSSKDKGNHSKANEYAQNAVDYAGKAVNMDMQSLPADHPQIAIHKKNLEYFEEQKITSE